MLAYRADVAAITIDSDQWPVCFIKIDGDMTPADFERYIASFNAFYERSARFSVITWVKSFSPNADIGRRVGVWFKETEPQIRKYLVKPFPAASKVCATPDEALAFTRAAWRSDAPNIAWPY